MNIRENRMDTFEKFPFVDRDDTRKIVEEIVHVVKNNNGDHLTSHTEMSVLYELALGLHTSSEVGHCLELGTFCGASAAVIASALEASKTKYVPLFTVDLYQPDTKKAANFSIARKSLLCFMTM